MQSPYHEARKRQYSHMTAAELAAEMDRLEAKLDRADALIAEALRPEPVDWESVDIPYKGQSITVLVDREDAHLLRSATWHINNQRKYGKMYVVCNNGSGRSTTYLHREITGAGPGQFVDHINGNGLDNRRANLRICTRSQNAQNRGKPDIPTTSRFKGVTWDKANRRWEVRVAFEGRQRYVGRYDDEVEAALAYDAAAKTLHGEFGYLNFPNMHVSKHMTYYLERFTEIAEAVRKRAARTEGGA